MNLIRLNTAFILPEDILERVVQLSRELSNKSETYFTLDNLNFYPHITIYPPVYPENNVDRVLKELEILTSKLHSVNLIFTDIQTIQGWIGIYFDLTLELKRLHQEIVGRLNPLREGALRDKYKNGSDYMMNFSNEQVRNIQSYGYPDAMTLYKPHLTITRFKNESIAEQVADKIKWDISDFIVERIGVHLTGEHGTCTKRIAEFKLL